jgi:hypothetical protein
MGGIVFSLVLGVNQSGDCAADVHAGDHDFIIARGQGRDRSLRL